MFKGARTGMFVASVRITQEGLNLGEMVTTYSRYIKELTIFFALVGARVGISRTWAYWAPGLAMVNCQYAQSNLASQAKGGMQTEH